MPDSKAPVAIEEEGEEEGEEEEGEGRRGREGGGGWEGEEKGEEEEGEERRSNTLLCKQSLCFSD